MFVIVNGILPTRFWARYTVVDGVVTANGEDITPPEDVGQRERRGFWVDTLVLCLANSITYV